MNIGILASGGDGAGMNACVFHLARRLKKHKLFLFYEGYKGLMENNICEVDLIHLKKFSQKGGIAIRTSRCEEFKTEEGVLKGFETYNKNKLDALVVLGGNGSQKGGQELSKLGANVFFIPCTIDNDVDGTDYAIGHDTAVKNAIDYIENVNATMQSFNRICIYETMGRHCADIAVKTAMEIKPLYLFINEKQTIKECIEKIRNYRGEDAPIILTRENLIDSNDLAKQIQKQTNYETKVAVIGYVQRGGNPTKAEVKFAKNFASIIANGIISGQKNKKAIFVNNKFILED